jgi:hypothetical protein
MVILIWIAIDTLVASFQEKNIALQRDLPKDPV